MKKIYFILGIILISSCNKTEFIEPESSLTYLDYPKGSGQSGDSVTGPIGFGYDATGICDTLSIRNKILKLNEPRHLTVSYPNYSGPGVEISGNNYEDLLRNMEYYPNKVDEPSISFLSNIKSLLKLANITDTSEYGRAYAYYSYFQISKSFFYHIAEQDFESELTDGFKNDINVLTAEEILNKYGTHVIVGAAIGAKFEVLYKCELKQNSLGVVDVSDLLYKRAKEYFGFLPSSITRPDINTNLQTKEQLVFNTLGFQEKLFGVINATNNNSNKISIDLNNVFNSSTSYQFVKMNKDGLIPLFELISNHEKKQAIKELIEKNTSR